MKSNVRPLFLSIAVLLGWFALVLQLDLSLIDRVIPLFPMLVRFFSYFTILTNIMVTLGFSFILFSPNSSKGRICSGASFLTAMTVYIVVVGLIYNIILRPLGTPKGLGILANEILHSIIPLMTVLYWVFFVRKQDLQWADVWLWLLYPFAYICLVLFIGHFSGHYPYPFIDVLKLGYPRVLLNALGVAVLFAGLSLLLIALSRLPWKQED